MKALYICSSIPSRGIHYYAAMLPRAMHTLGADVLVASSPGEADEGVRDRLKNEGIPIVDFPQPESRGARSSLESARFIAGLVREYAPDVIHVFGFAPAWRCWLSQLFFLKPKRKIPIVVSLEALRHGKPEEWLARIVASQFFNIMPCVVCALSTMELHKMQRAGLKRSKLEFIPNWIDFEQFEKDLQWSNNVEFQFDDRLKGNKVIIYLGNFVVRKGHKYLLQAVSQVVKNHKKCIFILAGEGPLLIPMRQYTNKLELSDHVLFPGRLPIEEIPALLHRADIAVVASLSETFGWNIIEPLLASRPVVTTDVGFAADLNATGGVLMVPRRDPQALAEALVRLIEHPELGQEIAQQGKAFVLENCEIHQVAKRYLEIYEACLK